MTDRAILAIIPCECECGNHWTEQEIITRNDQAYSYSLDAETYIAIYNRALPIEGTRLHPTRKQPVCFLCVDAPLSQQGWKDVDPALTYYDPQTQEMKQAWANKPRRQAPRLLNDTDRANQAQKVIDKLIDD